MVVGTGNACQDWEAGSGVAVAVEGVDVAGADVGVGTGDWAAGIGSSPHAASTAASARQDSVARSHVDEPAHVLHGASIVGPLMRYPSTILFQFH